MMDTKSTRSTLSTHSASLAEHQAQSARGFANLSVVCAPDRQQVGTGAQLSSTVLPIGRDPHEDGLHINDARLSRIHARITFDQRAGAYRIGDARSHNGTYVNGQRVDTAVLSNGDVIRVGDTLLVYTDREAMATARARALEAAPLSTPLMLRGEPGTGKEVIARLIHEHSGREGNFVRLDCAGISPDVLSGGLGGYRARAISGAAPQPTGPSTSASHHTLFLDEVGACPLALQQALLHALELASSPAVGANPEPRAGLRIIAATHLNLEAAVTAGAFLANLYACLTALTIDIPALRERKIEIIPLAEKFARGLGKQLSLSSDAAEALLCWHWPFNVRELQALVTTGLTRWESGGRIGLKELQDARPDVVRPILDRRAEKRGTPDRSPPHEHLG